LEDLSPPCLPSWTYFEGGGFVSTVYTSDIADPSKTQFGNAINRTKNVGGVPVKRLPIDSQPCWLWITPLLFKDLMKDDYDVIHAHCARSFQLDVAALVSLIRKKPLSPLLMAAYTHTPYQGLKTDSGGSPIKLTTRF